MGLTTLAEDLMGPFTNNHGQGGLWQGNFQTLKIRYEYHVYDLRQLNMPFQFNNARQREYLLVPGFFI